MAVGDLARDAIGDAAFDALVEVDRYTQKFSNILTRGTLHLAPQSPQVGISLPAPPMVTASVSYGYSLGLLWLQPRSPSIPGL